MTLDPPPLHHDEEEAWLMVRDYMDRPPWWLRRYLTKRQRWLVAYFKGRGTRERALGTSAPFKQPDGLEPSSAG